ncbi:MAG: hypothetical protein KAS02_01380 [Candidatus Pacebacteria bacterium]|nr:hypothetical protein [Candidatus Paceibacterota bacterium]
MGNYTYRINKISLGFMLSVAVFFDLIQIVLDIIFPLLTSPAHLIPIIGNMAAGGIFILSWSASSLLSIIAFLTFWLWFKIKGVGFLERFGIKKLLTIFILPLLELTFSFIPGLTVMVLLTYSFVRTEDELDKKGIIDKNQREKIGDFIKGHV